MITLAFRPKIALIREFLREFYLLQFDNEELFYGSYCETRGHFWEDTTRRLMKGFGGCQKLPIGSPVPSEIHFLHN
jgi:hypothetical protein